MCTALLIVWDPATPPLPPIWTRTYRRTLLVSKGWRHLSEAPSSCSIPNYEPVVVDKVVGDGVDVDEARHQAAGQFAAHPAYLQFLSHDNSPRDLTLIVTDCASTLFPAVTFYRAKLSVSLTFFKTSKNFNALILCTKDRLLLCRFFDDEFFRGEEQVRILYSTGMEIRSVFFRCAYANHSQK